MLRQCTDKKPEYVEDAGGTVVVVPNGVYVEAVDEGYCESDDFVFVAYSGHRGFSLQAACAPLDARGGLPAANLGAQLVRRRVDHSRSRYTSHLYTSDMLQWLAFLRRRAPSSIAIERGTPT